MPITKAVLSEHVCALPDPGMLATRGYLPGTEWTCDLCLAVYALSTEGSAAVYWLNIVPAAEVPDQSLPDAPNDPIVPVAE